MDWLNRKTYAIIAVGVAVAVLAIGLIFGATLAEALRFVPANATGAWQALATLIIEPIRFVLLNPFVGAIIAGLVWPFSALMVVLVLLVVIVSAFFTSSLNRF